MFDDKTSKYYNHKIKDLQVKRAVLEARIDFDNFDSKLSLELDAIISMIEDENWHG
jgi:hypothetical protein